MCDCDPICACIFGVLTKTSLSSLYGWTIYYYSQQQLSSETKQEPISSANGRLPI